MLSFVKQILSKYKTLVVKMNDYQYILPTTKINLQYICGINMVMVLTHIMHL
jgi:hypothetical protein